MAKISRDLTAGNMHPRETIFATGNFTALNAELVIPCDGCSTVTMDLRGTFSIGAEVSGTTDGVTWTVIPVRPINQAAKKYIMSTLGGAPGFWAGSIVGYKSVRVRCTSYTSGSCATTISASNSILDQTFDGMITADALTAVGLSGAAVTLTIPAPGAGLRQYITYLSIDRFAAAVLTAAATPVTITTTNLPGTLAFSFPADAAALGTLFRQQEDYAHPIMASALNTAVTIVCPITTGVIWRVTAGYYVAP